MDPEEQRAIVSLGGRASHTSGHAHEFTGEEAHHAGKMSGWIVSRDKKHTSQLGRLSRDARARRKKAEEGKRKK
jgi:uncharacterized protein